MDRDRTAVPSTVPDDADLRCRHCGYDLRAHAELVQRCPECATPVRLSKGECFLHRRDPEWLDAVTRGLVLRVFAPVAVVVSATASLLVGVWTDHFPATFMLCGAVAIAAASVVAAFLITRPDPGFPPGESEIRKAALCRAAAIAAAPALPLVTARVASPWPIAWGPPLDWALVLFGFAWPASLFLQARFVDGLSDIELTAFPGTWRQRTRIVGAIVGAPALIAVVIVRVFGELKAALAAGVAVLAAGLATVVVLEAFATIAAVSQRFWEAKRRRRRSDPSSPVGRSPPAVRFPARPSADNLAATPCSSRSSRWARSASSSPGSRPPR